MAVSHGCYNGMLIFFNKWREEIAKSANIPLALMEGWIAADLINPSLKAAPLWAEEILERNIIEWLPVKWESLKPDVLHVILHHGDDTGIIEVKDLIPLANRLEELLPLIKKGKNEINYPDMTERFIKGLKLAASKNKVVEFS